MFLNDFIVTFFGVTLSFCVNERFLLFLLKKAVSSPILLGETPPLCESASPLISVLLT
jgi:hypothetical protein